MSYSHTTLPNIDKWKAFVEKNPNGNVFQTYEMFEIYKNTVNYKPYVFAVLKNDNIVGLLLAVKQTEGKGLLGYFSSRIVIDGGPLILDDDPSILERLLRFFKDKTKPAVSV